MLAWLGLLLVTADPLSAPAPTTSYHTLQVRVESCVWDAVRGQGMCLMIDGPQGGVALFAHAGTFTACRMYMHVLAFTEPCPALFGFAQ